MSFGGFKFTKQFRNPILYKKIQNKAISKSPIIMTHIINTAREMVHIPGVS